MPKKTWNLFYFLFYYELRIFTLGFGRACAVVIFVRWGADSWPRGRDFLDTERAGLTCSILYLVMEASTVNMTIENETWQIIAGVRNFRFLRFIKIMLVRRLLYLIILIRLQLPAETLWQDTKSISIIIVSLKMNVGVLWDRAMRFCFYFLHGFKSKTSLSDTDLIVSKESPSVPRRFAMSLSFMGPFILWFGCIWALVN